MAFVLDASVALAWLLPDEASAPVNALLDRLEHESALAPAIWSFEVANALLIAERRKRISGSERRQFLDRLALLPVTLEQAPAVGELHAITDLARDHALSVYDGCYLLLAQGRGIPLATLDRNLRQAAARMAIATLP